MSIGLRVRLFLLNLVTENRFDLSSKDKNVRLLSNSSKETNFSSKTLGGLKLISININSIRVRNWIYWLF